MGILTKLQTQGSAFTSYDGTTPTVNPLATDQSKLHADLAGAPGYSLNGANTPLITAEYNAYDDGSSTNIPLPSLEDLNGVIPTISSHGNTTPGAASWTQVLPYNLNQPI
jgi:hypothetical protein